MMVYFHANGEDIGLAYSFCDSLCQHMRIPLIAMEYVGYSIYPSTEEPSEVKIVKDGENLINFLHHIMDVPYKDIIIVGRSIGTGVSC